MKVELFTLISPDSELFLAENHLHREPTWDCMVKVTESCPTLCNTRNYTVHRILQDRILEWVAFPFSRGSSQPSNQTQVSHIAGSFFFFFSSTSLLLPTHLPPPLCTHAQSCNPMDFNLPDSSVHGFFQARILGWVAISFSCRRFLYQLSHQGNPRILE